MQTLRINEKYILWTEEGANFNCALLRLGPAGMRRFVQRADDRDRR